MSPFSLGTSCCLQTGYLPSLSHGKHNKIPQNALETLLNLTRGYVLVISEREEKKRKDTHTDKLMWKRNTNWLLTVHSRMETGTLNLGMCSEGELSPRPFGTRDHTQTSWATWPGLGDIFKDHNWSDNK